MSIKDRTEFIFLMKIGQIVGRTLKAVADQVKAGVRTSELNAFTAELLERSGARAAPKAEYGFPGEICISINDEAVHGIPGARVIEKGDVVKLDLTAMKDGFVADAAVTITVPPVEHENLRLAECAQRAFERALEAVRANAPVHAIGAAVEEEAKQAGFSVLRDLCGHGVGRRTHEPPSIPNYFHPRARQPLTEGLVIAVEPILSRGSSGRVVQCEDGWTIRTADGSVAAQFEHTIIVTKGAPIIVTGV